MPKYVAHPLNYRATPSYDLPMTLWIHAPSRNDLRADRGAAPEFIRSSAVPAWPLVGNAFNLANDTQAKVDFSHSLRGAQEAVFRLKQDVKLLDNRPLHS